MGSKDRGLEGRGDGLLGESEFLLAPKETASYELVFSPLLPTKRKGSAVFFKDIVGEFWYDLDLLAEAAPPEEPETLNGKYRTGQRAPVLRVLNIQSDI